MLKITRRIAKFKGIILTVPQTYCTQVLCPCRFGLIKGYMQRLEHRTEISRSGATHAFKNEHGVTEVKLSFNR